jgi:hypothetical protein
MCINKYRQNNCRYNKTQKVVTYNLGPLVHNCRLTCKFHHDTLPRERCSRARAVAFTRIFPCYYYNNNVQINTTRESAKDTLNARNKSLLHCNFFTREYTKCTTAPGLHFALLLFFFLGSL